MTFQINDSYKTAAICAGISSIAALFLLNETGSSSLPIIGTYIPTYLLVGGATGISSIVGDYLVNEMSKKSQSINTMQYNELCVLKYAMSGLTTAASMKLLMDIPNSNLIKAAALGAASKAGAEWVDKRVMNSSSNSRLGLF